MLLDLDQIYVCLMNFGEHPDYQKLIYIHLIADSYLSVAGHHGITSRQVLGPQMGDETSSSTQIKNQIGCISNPSYFILSKCLIKFKYYFNCLLLLLSLFRLFHNRSSIYQG